MQAPIQLATRFYRRLDRRAHARHEMEQLRTMPFEKQLVWLSQGQKAFMLCHLGQAPAVMSIIAAQPTTDQQTELLCIPNLTSHLARYEQGERVLGVMEKLEIPQLEAALLMPYAASALALHATFTRVEGQLQRVSDAVVDQLMERTDMMMAMGTASQGKSQMLRAYLARRPYGGHDNYCVCPTC